MLKHPSCEEKTSWQTEIFELFIRSNMPLELTIKEAVVLNKKWEEFGKLVVH